MEHIQEEINNIEIGCEKALKIKGHTLYIKKDNNKKYLLSKYDPAKEAERLVTKKQSNNETNKETLWVVLGFCLGYIVEEIIKKIGKEARILVIEPNPKVLEEQLKMTRDKKWEQYKNLTMFAGVDFQGLNSKYSEIAGFETYYNTNIVSVKEYQESYTKYYTKVLQVIGGSRVDAIIRQNTREAINTTTLKNIVKNRQHIANRHDITCHKDKYKDIPAVIVSSGPSLDKNIHLLKEFKGLIFTVGRSLTGILNQDVEPDFVATLDPYDISYSTFMGNTKTAIPMVATAGAHPKLLEESSGPKYIVNNDVDMVKALIGNEVEKFPLGGSVATLCLSTAHYMGCNPIIFIGQDLAYTDMKPHASVSKLDMERSIKQLDRQLKPIKSYNGDTVYSDHTLISYKNWIESFIQVKKDVTYINATEGGAYIEGALHQPFMEVINKYKDIEKPELIHARVEDMDIDPEIYINATIDNLRNLTEYAIKGERLANKLLEEHSIHRGIRQHKIDSLLVRLGKIDSSIGDLEKDHLAKAIFSEIYNRHLMMTRYHETIKENKRDTGIRISKLSYDTYEKMKAKSNEWIECIIEAMEE